MYDKQSLFEGPDLISRSAIYTALVFSPILLWTLNAPIFVTLALVAVNWAIGLSLTMRGFYWKNVRLGFIMLLPAIGTLTGYGIGAALNVMALYMWVLLMGGGMWLGGYLSSRLLASYGRGIVRLSLALYAPVLFALPGYMAMTFIAITDPDL